MIDRADFLINSAPLVAPRLLGCQLIRQLGGKTIIVKIVEVEAYDQTDQASHTYRGQTQRNQSMFGLAGHLYVYFTYGMHHCMNIVTGRIGFGSGVLIRAVEPIEGIEIISQNRHGRTDRTITNGPGKVTQALAVDRQLDGHDLSASPLQLAIKPKLAQSQIVQTRRIGLSKAVDQPWRFYIKNNPYVSKK